MVFKDRLREKRQAAKMSQAKLGELAGVTMKSIQNYELGKRRPSNLEVVQRMAEALGTTSEYLLGGEGTLVVDAYERGGAKSARDVDELVSDITALFAGGSLDEEQKDGVMSALTRAYWDAKEENKKYTPKKYKK